MCLAAMTASAQTAGQSSDSLYIQKSYSQEQMLMPVNSTYLKHVSEAANWGRNWFIEAKGGASAFLGTPIGCGGVFDRVTPCIYACCSHCCEHPCPLSCIRRQDMHQFHMPCAPPLIQSSPYHALQRKP